MIVRELIVKELIRGFGLISIVVGTRYWDIVRHDWKGIFTVIMGFIFVYGSDFIDFPEVKQEESKK